MDPLSNVSPLPRTPRRDSSNSPSSTPRQSSSVRRLSKRSSVALSPTDRQKAVSLFEQFDIDGNGTIEATELLQILEEDAPENAEGLMGGRSAVNLDEFLELLDQVESTKEARYANAKFFQKILGRGRQRCLHEGVTIEDLRSGFSLIHVDVCDADIKKMIAVCSPEDHPSGRIAFDDFHAFKMLFDKHDGAPVFKCSWMKPASFQEAVKLWAFVFDEASKILERFTIRTLCERPEQTELKRELMRSRSRKAMRTGARREVPLPRGQPRALQQAIDTAQDDTVLSVGPGTVTEPITITRDGLSIVGSVDGHDPDTCRHLTVVEVTSAQPAVTLRCRRGELSNLCIINHGTGPALSIEQGYPAVTNCKASGVAGCLLIRHHAFPAVVDSQFYESQRGYGANVVESRAIFERCVFAKNRDAGLVVDKSSNVWVASCDFLNGKGCGIVVDDLSSCIVRDSEITGNVCPGVLVSNGGVPTLWRNRIHDNESTGVAVHDQGRGHIEENRFWSNEAGDVEISSSAGVSVTKNEFEGGPLSAIHLTKNATGHIDLNNIRNYSLAGISIGDRGTAATIVDNTIRRKPEDTTTSAICVHDRAGGKIVDNVMIGWRMSNQEGVAGVPLMMRERGDVVVQGNIARMTEREAYADTVFRAQRT